MFKLNFKIALRNIWRNKTSSFINISGLAIGLTSCLLLLLYVSYEWNFDKQWKGAENIYQVLVNFEEADGQIRGTGTVTPNAIGPAMKQEYPAIKAMSRISYADTKLIANGLKSFKRKNRFADADILNIFDYHFIDGDQKTALNSPNNVVLTESTAKILFGTTDVLNKSVVFENKFNLKITGVIKDLPDNVSIGFDYLLPWSLFESIYPWIKIPMWTNNNWTTLVRLSPQADPELINKGIKGMLKKNSNDAQISPFIFPLNKMHLYDEFTKGISTGGNIDQVRLFMGLAIGILLIACVNFMNMATAKSEKRAKEVGIKKTMGATRSSLVSQFLMESLVLTICSGIMAVALIEIALPLFNNLLDIQLGINYSNMYLWFGLIAVIIVTGLIAGSYPAFYLSSFEPIQVLKKKGNSSGFFSINLRQVLVVGQFSFAVILIIATTVIYKQLQFIKNRPVGYQINELLEMPQDGLLTTKFEVLKERLIQSGAVTSVVQTSGSLSDSNSNFWGLEWPGSTEVERHLVFNQLQTTYDFVKTTGVKLIEGRDFSPHFASDTAAVLLSRLAIKRMNLINPIGQIVKYQGKNCTVIGVFEDFVWGSPYEANPPLVLAFSKQADGYVTLRMNSQHPANENIATIEKITKEINPAYPSEVRFVDQLYAVKLKSEKVLGTLSNLFGGLAIFISCLGLFGLATYSAEQRTKEIGVRKVLGASVFSLMQLLSFSFLKMVIIAIIIAVPIANYVMGNWLDSFELHTSISWLIILMAALSTIGIAIFTVSFQAYRAAKANPVNALKYE